MRGPARLIVFSAVTAALTLSPAAAQASNEPLFVAQWSLRTMDAAAAWERTTGLGVRIGIVDTGVDLTHERRPASNQQRRRHSLVEPWPLLR